MNKLFIIFLVFSCISCRDKHPATAKVPVNPTADSLTAKLHTLAAQGYFAGFSVAVVNKDSVLYENGFGTSNLSSGEKYTAQTTQPVASVSKTLIGLALLKAQEMGKLRLSDPINNYLPFKVQPALFPDKEITIQQLATHTSSIHDNYQYMDRSYILDDASEAVPTGYPQKFNQPSANIGMEEFLRGLFSEEGKYYAEDNFTGFAPGQFYEYSNLGATMAALVVEKAVGMPYDAFVEQYILKPLQMDDSGFYGRGKEFSNRSNLYTGKKVPLPFYHCITYPDGGLVTSAHDMALYLQELIKGYKGNGKLLTAESYKQFYTSYLGPKSFMDGRESENPFSDEYNSGLFIGFSPKGYIGHTGGDPGISSLMFFDPETGIGRFLMINTDIDDKPGNDAFYAVWDAMGTIGKSDK
ncbi:serine hydrolase domain-containing protein [Flavobacterium sp. DGU11]|uniref:Serine hydrolase domain-containing protein n=1 Tax=Flavobacterium arundinis TaxID=3139143 RepID=A0ABU9HZD9_9FLAO